MGQEEDDVSSVVTHELQEKQQQFNQFNTRNLQIQNNVLQLKIVVPVDCSVFSVFQLRLFDLLV